MTGFGSERWISNFSLKLWIYCRWPFKHAHKYNKFEGAILNNEMTNILVVILSSVKLINVTLFIITDNLFVFISNQINTFNSFINYTYKIR